MFGKVQLFVAGNHAESYVKITSMKVRISITKPMAGLRYSESVINPPLKAWVVNVAQSAKVVHLR
jgi:hypothetical protein